MSIRDNKYRIPFSMLHDPRWRRPVWLLNGNDCQELPLTEAEAKEEAFAIDDRPEQCNTCVSVDGEPYWHIRKASWWKF